jgi:nucleoside-diphosphate-sugar epimerase
MKVAVTGAAGRIGRAVLQELKAAGNYEAVALDRALPPEGLARRSLFVDLADVGQVYGALAGVEAVIHLGAYPSTAHHPGELVYVNNTAACANVAAACAAFGIKRVVYTSSVTIYALDYQARHGGIVRLPADESVAPHPDEWYSLSKWTGEQIFAMAAEQHSLQVASLRPALVVGPDEYEARGRPRQDRDASGGMWGYVDSRDVAQVARLALEHLDELGSGNHAFNVGAADAHSAEPLSEVIPRFIPELADLAKRLTGTTPGFSIEKAQRLLGYQPNYSWRQFVALTP